MHRVLLKEDTHYFQNFENILGAIFHIDGASSFCMNCMRLGPRLACTWTKHVFCIIHDLRNPFFSKISVYNYLLRIYDRWLWNWKLTVFGVTAFHIRLFPPVNEIFLLSACMVGKPTIKLTQELVFSWQKWQLFSDLLKHLFRQSQLVIKHVSIVLRILKCIILFRSLVVSNALHVLL